MTSMYIKHNQQSTSAIPASLESEDLFEAFRVDDGPAMEISTISDDDDWEQVQERKRLRAALEAVDMELRQETETAIAALQHITAEMKKVGLLQQGAVQQEVDCLSNLVQSVHQGLGGSLSESLQEHLGEIRQYMQRVAQQIRQASDSQQLMQVAVRAVRQFLDVERSLIYRFDGGDRGMVVCESLELGWTPMQGEKLPPLCFGLNRQRDYQTQQVAILNETTQTATTPYHKQLTERFQIQASVTVPLFVKDKLWGLLVAQQCQQPRHWREATEVNFMVQLGHQLGLALQQALMYQQQDEWLQQSKLTSKIVERILQRRGIQDLCDTTVREMRHFMKADRVGVFQFAPNSGYDDGAFIAEDVDPAYPSALAAKVHDHCFGSQFADKYQYGRIQAVADIYNANLSDCHISILSDFAIRANLIVPLNKGGKLWGLLCVHQCSGPRIWKETEIELLKQIANQFMIAFQQIEASQRLEEEFAREQALNWVISRVRQTTDLDTIFTTTTQEVRRLLGIERVTIYKFREDFYGDFVSESGAGGFPKLVGSGWEDSYLHQHKGGRFRDNIPFVVDDIHEGITLWEHGRLNLQAPRIPLTDCHIDALQYYQARSCAVVAIFKGNKLWGLLSAFQNTRVHHWNEEDVKLLMQISVQMGIAIQQAESLKQVEYQFEREQAINHIVSKIRQNPELESVFAATTYELRRLLGIERVTIYKFRSDFFGDFIMESSTGDFPNLVGSGWEDPYLSEHKGGRFRDNIPLVVDDIHIGETLWENGRLNLEAPRKPMTDCHVEALEYYQARSCAVVAIFKGSELWGLLSAFQNTTTRHWKEDEVILLMQIATQIGVAIQQSDYVKQIEYQFEREQAINHIVGKIRQNPELESVFAATTYELRRLLGIERVTIYKFRSDFFGDFIMESSTGGFPNLVGSGWEDPYLSEHKGGRFRDNIPLVVDDIHEGEILWENGHLNLQAPRKPMTDCHVEALEYYQARSCAVVAIFKGSELWGLLSAFQNTTTRHWKEDEVILLMQIATQIGVAIQQSEYVRQIEYQFEREQAINHIVGKIRQNSELESVFAATTYELRRLLGIERVTIYKFRSDFFGDFMMESSTGGFPNLVGSGWEDPYLSEHKGGRFRDNIPLVVDDIHEGETLWENGHLNLQAPRKPMTDCHVEALEYYQARSCAVVAIFKGSELWGLLSAFQNTTTRHWKEDEVILLMQIATQIGVAIQQSDYVKQIEAQFTREQALNRVITKIRQTVDLDAIFTTTTQELKRLLGIERVTIYKFREDFFGDFVNESDPGGFPKLVGSGWEDSYLNKHQGGRFRENSPFVVDDIHEGIVPWENGRLNSRAPRTPLTDCHIEALEYYQACSCAVVAIFKGNQLWGLLSAFQNTEVRHWEEVEVKLMMQVATQIGVAIQQTEYIQQIQNQSHLLSEQAERATNYARVIGQIGQRLIERIRRQDLNIGALLASTTQDLRHALRADRVAIYRFDADWSGEFIAEDHASTWVKLVGTELARVRDTWLQENQGGRYRQNQSLRVDNIYTVGHSTCHVELLESWGAKAYMIAPIFKGETLWGLLGAYQNSNFRQWDDTEMNLLAMVGVQLGNALLQVEYIHQVEEQSQQLQAAAEREKADRDHLQQQIVEMLSAVRPALQGDLTVRAPITEDAVGTVADAYNNTIQSLRKLVMQVKGATERVRETSEVNGEAIAHLSQQTQQELSQVTRALQRLEEMVQATETVTQNAQRMEAAVQRANETVQTGDNAMNLTVEGILAIRETVSETTKKIKRLSESSQKISKVVNVISNFTTQTQLLALNAAIEATRAGEYGRGFAVVADEVRSLAQQSSEATGEIEALVQEIQMETNGVSAAMDLGIQQVVEGTSLVNQTRQSLNEIVTATAQIRDLIQGITASAQAQMQQSNVMTQAMEDVAAIANKTSTDSTEIATSFQELIQTAELLQRSVDQFKVN